jgi:hypothetical protein
VSADVRLRQHEAALCGLWVEGLQSAYGLARGERSNELEGKYVPRFDGRGLHPYSHVVGQVQTCEVLLSELSFAQFDPVTLRRLAREDADELFRQGILEEAPQRLHEGDEDVAA